VEEAVRGVGLRHVNGGGGPRSCRQVRSFQSKSVLAGEPGGREATRGVGERSAGGGGLHKGKHGGGIGKGSRGGRRAREKTEIPGVQSEKDGTDVGKLGEGARE